MRLRQPDGDSSCGFAFGVPAEPLSVRGCTMNGRANRWIRAADGLAKEFRSVKTILVAIDDCESTTTASPVMQRVCELARAFSSKVWLLHVVPQSGPLPFNVDRKRVRGEIASELRHEHQFLQRLAQCLRDREIDASALLTEGATSDTILEESQRLDADLVVVGSHGHGLLYRALLDGTGERLLGESECPIMFVPERRP